MGSTVSRIRVLLTQAAPHRVRSERNNIVVDFDKTAERSVYASPVAPREPPNAMRALAQPNALAAREAAVDAIRAIGLAPSMSAPARAAVPTAAAFPAPAAAGQQPASTTGLAQQETARKYTGALSNWTLEDADLRGTLKLIQDISGLNMVVDPGITGKVTLFLTQVPWDQALDVILKMNKLGVIVEDSIVRIASLSVLADEEVQRRKLTDEQALSGQLITANKTLSYSKAADMQPLLKNLLSTRGQVQVDVRTNTLIITDLQGRVDNVVTLVGTLDRAQPQVEIEARIVQTDSETARALGIQWGFNGRVSPALGNTTNLAFPNSGSLAGRVPGVGVSPGTAVNLPAAGATSGVGLALGSINGAFNLDVALTAIETNRKGRVLSTPKVSTLNNVEAEIAQGVQVPYQTTANNTVTTNFKDAALTLKVKPQITEAGTVIMQISVDNGSEGAKTYNGIPSINTQRANTTVLVSDGETTVIGGIFQGNESKTVNGTPGLMRVPIIKWLFKSESINDRNTELLIFITPRIVRK